MDQLEKMQEPDMQKKYDKHQLLILFKMYNFEQGVSFLLENLDLHEELLFFYIDKKNPEKILYVCKKYGIIESNLWL